MFRVVPDVFTRNRAYVIDNQYNRLFYGTVYKCYKFIEYMLKEDAADARAEQKECSSLELVSN